jgi:transporter family protein
MPWLAASLLSALFLGCYELSTKHAVRGNAVLPVLFLSNVCGATVWLALLAVHALRPDALSAGLVVDVLTPLQHAQILLKSGIVSCAWVCTYFAVKHLPVSLTSPVAATGPMWTLFGGLALFGERPAALQVLGVLLTLGSFFGLSLAGRGEGVHFHRNKWFGWLAAGVLLNAVSALYDKFLLGRAGFRVPTVQCWFALYLALLFLPFALGWKLRWWPRHEFHWRWSIPLVAGSLLLADYIYFTALRDPAALISIVSSLRRGSTLVAFAGGVLLFGEHYSRAKFLAVLGVLGGIALTVLG